MRVQCLVINYYYLLLYLIIRCIYILFASLFSLLLFILLIRGEILAPPKPPPPDMSKRPQTYVDSVSKTPTSPVASTCHRISEVSESPEPDQKLSVTAPLPEAGQVSPKPAARKKHVPVVNIEPPTPEKPTRSEPAPEKPAEPAPEKRSEPSVEKRSEPAPDANEKLEPETVEDKPDVEEPVEGDELVVVVLGLAQRLLILIASILLHVNRRST